MTKEDILITISTLEKRAEGLRKEIIELTKAGCSSVYERASLENGALIITELKVKLERL